MYFEAGLIVERQNAETATQAVMLRMAIGSVLSKDAAKAFDQQVKALIAGADDGQG